MASEASPRSVLVTVQDINDVRRRFYMRVLPETTLFEIKEMINIAFNVPVDQLLLVAMGQFLCENRTMGTYGLQSGHVIYFIRSLLPAPSSGGTSVAPAAPVRGNSTSDISSVVATVQNQESGGGNSASLISGLDGSSDGTVTGVLINVRYSNEGKLDIRVKPELTVGEFKGLITELQNIPANEQRLIYCGQFLQDHRTIGSYGIQEGHVIHLARRFVPSTSASASAAAPVGGNSTPDISTRVHPTPFQRMEAPRNYEEMRARIQNRIMSNIALRQTYENRRDQLLNSMTGPNGNFSASYPITALFRNQTGGQVEDGTATPFTMSTYANSGPSVPNANPLPYPWGTVAAGAGGMFGGQTAGGGAGMFGGQTAGGAEEMAEELYATQDTRLQVQFYATELTQLQQMGFVNTRQNIRALIASAGNVRVAAYRLLHNLIR